jgi:hypothetical protein
MIVLPASTTYTPAGYIIPGGHALKLNTRLRRYRQLRAALAVAGGIAMAGVALPAAAAPADLPDLQVSMAFEKATYALGDTATLTITIKNAGKATAAGVNEIGGAQEGVDWGSDLHSTTPFDLAPGATKTLTRHGVIDAGGSKLGYAWATWEFQATNGDANMADNTGTARTAVPGATGAALITVYRTTDGTFKDGDPGLAGVKVTILSVNDLTKVYAEATTDAAGKALFHQVPAGDYQVRFVAPNGWKIPDGSNPTTTQVLGGADGTQGVVIGAIPVPNTGGSGGGNTGGTGSPSPMTSSTGATPGTAGLPVTGTNVATLGTAGAALITLGGVAYAIGRRRRA